jgi:hypothetical protein
VPAVQVVPDAHLLPQAPQLFGSVVMSIHWPLQQLGPAVHGSPAKVAAVVTVLPLLQKMKSGLHTLPGSQFLPGVQHTVKPVKLVQQICPAAQHSPLGLAVVRQQTPAHLLPHVAQFAGSLVTSVHLPAQHSALPPLLMHTTLHVPQLSTVLSGLQIPLQQPWELLQTLPHLPQLLVVVILVQMPLQQR